MDRQLTERIVQALAGAAPAHRELVADLRMLAADRLAATRGLDLAAVRDRAGCRSALGPAAFDRLDPDKALPAGSRLRRGEELAAGELADLLTALERLR